MPGELIPIIIVPTFFFCIAYITQVISDNRIRREFISKNVSADIIQKLFVDKRAESVSGNLKWGLLWSRLDLPYRSFTSRDCQRMNL